MLCIIWSILAVELMLVWNNIEGIYTISSTGQLIPFIIGVVGLARLFQGISVRRCTALSTEVLMGLLDVEPKVVFCNRTVRRRRSIGVMENIPYQELTRPPSVTDTADVSADKEAAELTNAHNTKRSQSISITGYATDQRQESPNTISVDDMVGFTMEQGATESKPFHLDRLFDIEALQRAYGCDGIETYELRDGRMFWIVKQCF